MTYATPEERLAAKKARIRRKNQSAAGKARQARYHATDAYKERMRQPDKLAYQKAYKDEMRRARPHVLKARAALNTAVKMGILVRPDSCQRCQKPGRPEGHHYLGWEPEHWLAVEWLCTPCHRSIH